MGVELMLRKEVGGYCWQSVKEEPTKPTHNFKVRRREKENDGYGCVMKCYSRKRNQKKIILDLIGG